MNTNSGISDKAGHKQNCDLISITAGSLGELQTIHPRHLHIGEEKIEGYFAITDHFQRLKAFGAVVTEYPA